MDAEHTDLYSPKARGGRARSLRTALRYSRRAIAEKHEFKPATLQNWEDGRYGGLTEQGAQLLSRVYQKEGLDCTVEWLLFGIGEHPLASQEHPEAEDSAVNEEKLIAKELKVFYEHCKDAVDMQINDDGMTPLYYPGDRVAGTRLFDQAISQALDQICIIHPINGPLTVRQLRQGSKVDHFQLSPINSNNQPTHEIAHSELLSVAPVIWMRRKRIYT